MDCANLEACAAQDSETIDLLHARAKIKDRMIAESVKAATNLKKTLEEERRIHKHNMNKAWGQR